MHSLVKVCGKGVPLARRLHRCIFVLFYFVLEVSAGRLDHSVSFLVFVSFFLSIFLSFFTSGSKYKPPLLWATDELFCRPLKPVPGRAGFIVRVFLFSDWEAVDHTQQFGIKAVMMSSPDSTRTAHNKCKRRIFIFPRPVELKPPSSTGETERN